MDILHKSFFWSQRLSQLVGLVILLPRPQSDHDNANSHDGARAHSLHPYSDKLGNEFSQERRVELPRLASEDSKCWFGHRAPDLRSA